MADRREEIARWAHRAVINIPVTLQTSARAYELTAAGLKALDAAHLACAEAAACDRLLTCDDQMLRKARHVHVGLQVQNPVIYIQEVTDAGVSCG